MKEVKRRLKEVVYIIKVFKHHKFTKETIYRDVKAYLVGTLGLNLSNKKDSELIDVAFNKIYGCNCWNINESMIVNEILMEVL